MYQALNNLVKSTDDTGGQDVQKLTGIQHVSMNWYILNHVLNVTQTDSEILHHNNLHKYATLQRR